MQSANQLYNEGAYTQTPTEATYDKVSTTTPSVQLLYAIAMFLITTIAVCFFCVWSLPCMQRCRQMIEEACMSSMRLGRQSREADDAPPRYDEVYSVNHDSGGGSSALPTYTDYIRSLGHVVVVVDLTSAAAHERRLNAAAASVPAPSSSSSSSVAAVTSSLSQQPGVINTRLYESQPAS